MENNNTMFDPSQMNGASREQYFPQMPVPAAVICALTASFLAALSSLVPSAVVVIFTAVLSVTLYAMLASYAKAFFAYPAAAVSAVTACVLAKSLLPLAVISALCIGGAAMGRSFRKNGACRDVITAAAVSGGLCLIVGIALLWGIGMLAGNLPAPAALIGDLSESLTAQLADIEVMTEQGKMHMFDENSAKILVRYAFFVSPAFFAIGALILCALSAKLFRLLSLLVGGGYVFPEPWQIEANASDGVMYLIAYILSFLFSTVPDFELPYYIAGNLAAIYIPFLLLTTIHAVGRFLRGRISPGLRILCLLLFLFLISAGSNLLLTASSCFGAYLAVAKKRRRKKKPDEEN